MSLEYRLVSDEIKISSDSAPDHTPFQTKINQLLEKGWSLHGPTTSTSYQYVDAGVVESTWVYLTQALTR